MWEWLKNKTRQAWDWTKQNPRKAATIGAFVLGGAVFAAVCVIFPPALAVLPALPKIGALFTFLAASMPAAAFVAVAAGIFATTVSAVTGLLSSIELGVEKLVKNHRLKRDAVSRVEEKSQPSRANGKRVDFLEDYKSSSTPLAGLGNPQPPQERAELSEAVSATNEFFGAPAKIKSVAANDETRVTTDVDNPDNADNPFAL